MLRFGAALRGRTGFSLKGIGRGLGLTLTRTTQFPRMFLRIIPHSGRLSRFPRPAPP
jgi:hypothetical protein